MIRSVIIAAMALSCSLAAAVGTGLKTGERAPDFSLSGSDGKIYKLSQFIGKVVVLEWFNQDCPYVHKFYDSKTMQGLQKDEVAKGGVWLTIASSAKGKEGYLDASTAKKVHDEKGMMNTALLLDGNQEAANRYKAKTAPHMFVINKEGRIAYQGAMDDRPSADKASLGGAQNYVTAALMALDKGTPVKSDATTPYGCSVKY